MFTIYDPSNSAAAKKAGAPAQQLSLSAGLDMTQLGELADTPPSEGISAAAVAMTPPSQPENVAEKANRLLHLQLFEDLIVEINKTEPQLIFTLRNKIQNPKHPLTEADRAALKPLLHPEPFYHLPPPFKVPAPVDKVREGVKEALANFDQEESNRWKQKIIDKFGKK